MVALIAQNGGNTRQGRCGKSKICTIPYAKRHRQNPEHTPGTVDGHYSITPVLLIGTSFDYTKAPDAKYEQIDLG
jgi:hypothetical protein